MFEKHTKTIAIIFIMLFFSMILLISCTKENNQKTTKNPFLGVWISDDGKIIEEYYDKGKNIEKILMEEDNKVITEVYIFNYSFNETHLFGIAENSTSVFKYDFFDENTFIIEEPKIIFKNGSEELFNYKIIFRRLNTSY